ncbi:MAG: hypothetical protein ACYTG5_06790 [Planctomycetota bacterium]
MRSTVCSLWLGIAGLTACAPEEAAPSRAEGAVSEAVVRVLDLEQLDAMLAAKRGKGLLVNFWATW